MSRCTLTAVAAAAVLSGAAHASLVADWEVKAGVESAADFHYDGGRGVQNAINSNFDITNLNGRPLIGVSFTILPTEGWAYEPGAFDQIVFDAEQDTPDDEAPWVPPSLLNPTPFTVEFSNFTTAGPQTVTFMFEESPLDFGEELQARFQIERPTNDLFDVRVSPLIPASGPLTLLGAAGLAGRPRRRRSAERRKRTDRPRFGAA